MRLKILSILAMLLWCGFVHAGEKLVSLATLDEYPPLCFAKPTGENTPGEIIEPGKDSKYLRGYSWDVVREAFQARGYTIKLTVLPFNRAETAAKLSGTNRTLAKKKERSSIVVNFEAQGVGLFSTAEKSPQTSNTNYRADLLFPTVKTPQRLEVFKFSENYIDRINTTLYVYPRSGFKFTGLNSLEGKKIGIMKGWSYGGFLESIKNIPNIRKLEFTDLETGFRLLRNRRIDVLVGYGLIFDRELKRIRWQKAFKKFASRTYLEEFICGVKNNSRTDRLLAEFEKGLQQIKDNGTLQKLQTRWGLSQKIVVSENKR